MSEFLNLQAALGQTSVLSGLSGANARGVSGDGGFGAVLGAVMADSMGGVSAADISAGVNADVSRADGLADGNANVGEDVSEDTAAAALEADNAAKALAELYGALGGLEGSNGELPDVMFTSEGAKAFISVLERYISQGNVPPKDIEELWKDVSADEKDAYADILGAIALGSVVLPDENAEMFEVSSEDVLGFVLKEAGKLAMRPAASRKSDKDEEEAASYIMSVFIAPSFSVNTETENAGAAIAEGDLTSAVRGDLSLAADEVVEAVQHTTENIPEADNGISADENAGTVSTFTMSELGEAIAERVFEADPAYADELEKFCGEFASELKAEVAKDMANAERAFAAAPEDIGRQAFMARVSAPVHEASVARVEAVLRQNAAENIEAAEMSDAVIGGTARGESEVSVTNAENDNISDNAIGGTIPEDDKNVGMNAFEGAVQAAQNAAVQGSRVFETEEAAYAEDVPVSPADTEEIARRISENISKGRNESIILRLDPEDLGEIKVTVSRKAGETVVAFEAHKSESAQLIGDRAAALAESLAAKGIAVREISVTDMSSNSSGGNARNSGEFYGGNRHANTDGSANGSANNGADGNASGNGYSRHYYFEEPEETPAADESYYYNKEADLWLRV
ncbi:MAG: flagellar hook-length control protein FliK [Oscillospiraceae bacterium]|nr:flagellar hook-length control protein FliK [Oscillospiraceae bacterium]